MQSKDADAKNHHNRVIGSYITTMNQFEFTQLIEHADLEGHDKAVSFFRRWYSTSIAIPAVIGPAAVWVATNAITKNMSYAHMATAAFVFLQFMGFLSQNFSPASMAVFGGVVGVVLGYFSSGLEGLMMFGFAGLFLGVAGILCAALVELVYFCCRPLTYPLLYIASRRMQAKIKKETPAWYSDKAKLELKNFHGALFHCYGNRIYVANKKKRQNGQAAANGANMYTRNELYAAGLLYAIPVGPQMWSNDGSSDYQPPMINPSTGLPMTGPGMGGVDVGGNTWGGNNGL